jgi:hypothetical protein
MATRRDAMSASEGDRKRLLKAGSTSDKVVEAPSKEAIVGREEISGVRTSLRGELTGELRGGVKYVVFVCH